MNARCLVVALLFCRGGAHAQQAKIPVAEIAGPASIRLTNQEKARETFRTIEITEGSRHFRMTPHNRISCIPTSKDEQLQLGLLTEHVDGMLLDRSRCFFRAEYGTAPKHTVLAFVSEPGTGATPVYVLGFHSDGTPFVVLERDELDLIAFLPTGTGSAHIVGKATLSEAMYGDGLSVREHTLYATTYDPASVYLVQAGSKAAYSLQASRDYNQTHYVWAGPHSREDYAVIFNLPGRSKPFGIAAKQLDSFMAKAQSANRQ